MRRVAAIVLLLAVLAPLCAVHGTESRAEVSVQTQAQATTQVGVVRNFCEICILVMQMKQRGQPHLCAGLNANYYITVRLI